MLSIIISSYQPHYYIALEKNIADTIGIPYEIIKIDNNGIMGICEAYNRGAEKAQYDFLLFLHEDVLFETQDWGRILMNNILQVPNFEILGIAGSNYIPYAPSPWWGIEDTCFSNIVHKNITNGHTFRYSFDENFTSAKYIDGVFIFCRKNTWKKTKFNEKNKGFHAYDVQFSLEQCKSDAIYLINNVLLEHFSAGKPDKIWLKSLISFWKKDCNNAYNYNKHYEIIAFKNLADQLRHHKFSKISTVIILLQHLSPSRLNFKNTILALKKVIDIIRY